MTSAFPVSAGRDNSPLDPLALYASAIDTSDYAVRVAPLIRRLALDIGDLVDVGAGGGQLGSALLEPGRAWTAIEPSPVMQARLAVHERRPRVIPFGWDDERVVCEAADTVLAATMPGYFHDPLTFLARCRTWARRQVIWAVPAQKAPKGLILAACLPREWHGEDETPGIDLVLPKLGGSQPDRMDAIDWTFSLVLSDLPAFAAFQADRLGWVPGDPRRPELIAHLSKQAVPTEGGLCLSCHRRSAILVWTLS
ncbi:class I SAM-dependent methyltransferase [Bosea sp. NPDC055332]